VTWTPEGAVTSSASVTWCAKYPSTWTASPSVAASTAGCLNLPTRKGARTSPTTVAEERDGIGTEPGFDIAERQSSILKSIDEAASCVLVAAVKDVVVGNLGIQARHGQTLGSLGMMVARDHRGQGIGARLLDDGLHWGLESGLHKVDLGVWPHNTAAIALYRSRGFTVEGRRRRHFRRANGELWDMVTMGLVFDTQSPGSSYPDAENL
jgi:RimJ/RimL family protein N-acetyltransferase